MREDLKGHNLTFTEIAKLVGENWQSLPPAEKEAYESQANSAKEKYHRNLVEYKKTPEHRKYAQYLQEFKEKQAKQNQGLSHKTGTRLSRRLCPSSQSSDANKRPKIEPARLRHGSTSSSAATGGTTSSGSGSTSMRDSRSSSERMQGSEPPPTRQERMDSISSIAESHRSLTGDATMSYPMDESRVSPRMGGFDLNGGREAAIRNVPLRDGGGIVRVGDGVRQHLPSLSDMLDDGRSPKSVVSAPDGNPYTRSGFMPAGAQPHMSDRASVMAARTPLLRHDESSVDSSGSGSPAGSPSSFGRPPGDGSLPIHALLSTRQAPRPPQSRHRMDTSPTFASSMDSGKPSALADGAHGPRGYGS